MAFLIIDMKRGGMDGFYFERSDAEQIAESWKEELRHGEVIVAETKEHAEIHSYCFLADRRIRGSLHGPEVPMGTNPPAESWKKKAITQCSEILRDLYLATDYEQCDIPARIEKLLSTVNRK